MKQEELKLYVTENKSHIVVHPRLKEVFATTKGIKRKLLPLLKIDGGEIEEKWKDIPFVFIAHSIKEERLDFKLNDDNTYTIFKDIASLGKIDDYNDYSLKRENVETTAKELEEVTYASKQHYGNGLLLEEGIYNYSFNNRHIFKYTHLHGKNMPVQNKELHYLGTEWAEVKTTNISYDSAGFLKAFSAKTEKQAICVKEELIYNKKGRNIIVTKTQEPHKPIHSREYKPFKVEIKEKGASYLLVWDGIAGRNTEKDEVSEVLAKEAFHNYFIWSSNGKFFKRTFHVKENQFKVVPIGNGDFPKAVSYTVDVEAFNKENEIIYKQREENSVVFQIYENGNTYTIAHKVDFIEVTTVYKFDHTSTRKLPGFLNLQQAIVMIVFSFQFYEEDFDKKRSVNFMANAEKVSISEFKYNRKDDLIIRENYNVKVKQDRKIGELHLKKPIWYQKEHIPLDTNNVPMQFIAQLTHKDLFGTLYLYYSEKERMISQIYQTT